LDETALRRAALLSRFAAAGIDSLLVTHLPGIRYLTGFTGSNGMLLATRGQTTFFTDSRYTTQARAECSCRVEIVKGRAMLPAVAKAVAKQGGKRIGMEPSRLTLVVYEFLKQGLPLGAEFVKADGLVDTLRMVKSAGEIAAIRRAVATTSRAFAAAMKRVKAGMAERDVAAEIDYQARRAGAEGPCFETIVASGERAALPHARPTAAAVQGNRLLLIDMGACQDGYASDMTRTVGMGHPPTRLRSAYQAVWESQLAALDAVRPGIPVEKVDAAARRVLRKHGLEKAFVHSLGHGLGLEIHEGPRLGRGEKAKLEAGMVITIEPGVYVPDDYGIRIEDTVLVTAAGCEVLTPTPKTFQTY
jgi:Xaa-Pro aminopeptidase